MASPSTAPLVGRPLQASPNGVSRRTDRRDGGSGPAAVAVGPAEGAPPISAMLRRRGDAAGRSMPEKVVDRLGACDRVSICRAVVNMRTPMSGPAHFRRASAGFSASARRTAARPFRASAGAAGRPPDRPFSRCRVSSMRLVVPFCARPGCRPSRGAWNAAGSDAEAERRCRPCADGGRCVVDGPGLELVDTRQSRVARARSSSSVKLRRSSARKSPTCWIIRPRA